MNVSAEMAIVTVDSLFLAALLSPRFEHVWSSQCYNFRVSVTSGVLFTYTSIIFCTFIFWLKGVSRNSPRENLANINESIVLKTVHLIGHISNTQRPVFNRVKTHSLWVSISESFYVKTCTVFPMSFHWCSAWFKHILLLSTKGLGVAKLRCKAFSKSLMYMASAQMDKKCVTDMLYEHLIYIKWLTV